MDFDNLERQVEKSRRFAIGTPAFLIAGYMFWFVLVKNQVLSQEVADWGTFGDFIGGLVNPIIAYLAFYWLTVSVLVQKKEMEAARKAFGEQIKLTRNENVRLQLAEQFRKEGEKFDLISRSKFREFSGEYLTAGGETKLIKFDSIAEMFNLFYENGAEFTRYSHEIYITFPLANRSVIPFQVTAHRLKACAYNLIRASKQLISVSEEELKPFYIEMAREAGDLVLLCYNIGILNEEEMIALSHNENDI